MNAATGFLFLLFALPSFALAQSWPTLAIKIN